MPYATSQRSRRSVGGATVLLVFGVIGAVIAMPGTAFSTVVFNFDQPPPPQNTYAFPPFGATGDVVLTTQSPVLSGPYALKFSGTDTAGASAAYVKIFDVDISVTTTTTLSYHIYPVDINSTYVAVDLFFDDGSALRDGHVYDDAGVLLHPTAQHERLQVGVYNTVQALFGPAFSGRRIRQVVVGHGNPGTGPYEARIDDIAISDSRFVRIEGDKVDEDNAPFTHSQAIVDPYGYRSTCGPDLASQSLSSLACDGSVPHYVAQVRAYTKGYVKLVARVPRDWDVLVSVCAGPINDAYGSQFNCRDHPAESFCRPKQSSSTKIYVWLPPTSPPLIDIRWKYIPEGHATNYPVCDRKGPYRASMLSAESNAGPLLGDNDGSGAVTVTDGVQILRCAQEIKGAFCSPDRADINCDGTISITDAVLALFLAARVPIRGGCDRDHDGLLDDWEARGYDHDGDGLVDVDLPAFGARPDHKDVFVECDYMNGLSQLRTDSLQDVVTAFASAPVSNLVGGGGVSLHVDTGQFGGSDSVSFQSVTAVSSDLDVIRQAHFAPARRPVFRYCVIGQSFRTDSDAANATRPGAASGSSFGASNAGAGTNPSFWMPVTAGVFMHELGHALGLGHGGMDAINNKPNYLSVMNYTFNCGVRLNGTPCARRDFSRFVIEDLDENALDESTGLTVVGGDGLIVGYGTFWMDSFARGQIAVNAGGALDWNGDGDTADRNVSVDLNRDGIGILRGRWNDWDNLQYAFDAVGLIGSGSGLNDATQNLTMPATDCPP